MDWASHGNRSGRMIEEHIDFDNTVQAVVDWVRANSNWGETLLIVTSDHETGYLTGPGSNPTWTPIVNSSAGVLPGMEWHSPDHTNSLIPLYAKGDAARMFRRYADQFDPASGNFIDNSVLAGSCSGRWIHNKYLDHPPSIFKVKDKAGWVISK